MGFFDKLKDKAKSLADGAADATKKAFKDKTVGEVTQKVVEILLKDVPQDLAGAAEEIGRASCRERV